MVQGKRNTGELKMARTPKSAKVGNGGETAVEPLALADLNQVSQDLKAAAEAAEARLATLRNTRTSLMDQVEQVDALIVAAGGEAAPTKRRGRKVGSKSGPRGPRDPLGLKGYIARALIKNGDEMKVADLTERVLKDGWKNASKTFPTQVYQICGKMSKEGTISNPGRGTYGATAATRKFLTALQAEIKAAE